MTIVRVNADGTVSPLEKSSVFSSSAGSSQRDKVISEIMGWAGFLGKYSDLITDVCLKTALKPLRVTVLYITSVASLLNLIKNIAISVDKGGEFYEKREFQKGEDFSFQLLKLSQRGFDFYYRVSRLELLKTVVETAAMRIGKDVLMSVENIWKVVRADRSLKGVVNLKLKKLKVQEGDWLYASAVADLTFHAFGFAALLTTGVVTGQMMLATGVVSIITKFLAKNMTQERANEESRIAAKKVNDKLKKTKLPFAA